MKDQTLAAAPNYAHIIELDSTPEAAEPTWLYALVNITECAPENDEQTSEEPYYHLLGSTETNVDSNKFSLEFTGHRLYGDPCQDYVQSLVLGTGQERKTRYRWTLPDGTIYTGECTITGLNLGSMGEANSKGDFGFKLNFNTVTKERDGNPAAPTAITASAVAAKIGETVAIGAKVTPTEANQRCHYAIDNTEVASVDADGNVTGLAPGDAKIAVKAAGRPSVYAVVEVTVSEEAPSK